jgi:hypothetical protein
MAQLPGMGPGHSLSARDEPTFYSTFPNEEEEEQTP